MYKKSTIKGIVHPKISSLSQIISYYSHCQFSKIFLNKASNLYIIYNLYLLLMSYVQDSIMGVLWGHFILQLTTSGILSLWRS